MTAIVIPTVQQTTPNATAIPASRCCRADIRAAIRAMMMANGMIRSGRWTTPRQLAKMEMIARNPATVSDADQRLDGVVP